MCEGMEARCFQKRIKHGWPAGWGMQLLREDAGEVGRDQVTKGFVCHSKDCEPGAVAHAYNPSTLGG